MAESVQDAVMEEPAVVGSEFDPHIHPDIHSQHGAVYRWRDIDAKGKPKMRALVIGSVKQYPTETAAWKAVSTLRLDVTRALEGRTPDQWQQDAFGQVNAWLDALGMPERQAERQKDKKE